MTLKDRERFWRGNDGATAIVDVGGGEEVVVVRLGTMAIGELPYFGRLKEGSCCPRSRGIGGGAIGSSITKGCRGLGSMRGMVHWPGNNGGDPSCSSRMGVVC